MDLDPKLVAIAAGAIAPTKFLVDSLVVSTHVAPQLKLLIAYLIGFLLIFCYQVYTGDVVRVDTPALLSGNILAAIETLIGAVLLTHMQRQAETKKTERKRKNAEATS